MSEFDQDSEAAAQLLLEKRKAASAIPPSPSQPRPYNTAVAQQLAAILKRMRPQGQ